MKPTFDEETYKKHIFSEIGFPKGIYEYCSFINCDFSSINLSGSEFIECEFQACDLSLVIFGGTVIRECTFTESKIIGAHFYDCQAMLFSARFKQCQLDLASFYAMNIKDLTFDQCQLKEVDFTEALADKVVFENCNLDSAVFNSTSLIEADFRSANNYIIDPNTNKIKKAKFSYPAVLGLLQQYQINIE